MKLSDSTYRDMSALADLTDGTMADVFREALSIFAWLAKEYRQGNRLMIKRGDELTELLIPSLARTAEEEPAEGAAPPRRRRPNASRE